jgi:capsular exopolysaccharide synthesis family protein
MEDREESIDFRQYWSVIRRRWLPASAVTGGVIALTTIVTLLQKPVYEALGKVLLKQAQSVASTVTESSDSSLGALSALANQSNPISTEAEIIKTAPIINETIDTLRLKDKDGVRLRNDDFLDKLAISNPKDTDILEITYRSTDKEEAARVVAKLIDVYRRKNVESNRTQASSARKFIQAELPKAEREIRRVEVAVRDFKERSKVVSLPDEARVAVESTGELQKILVTTQGAFANSQSRAQALRKQIGLPPEQALEVNALSQSPAIQEALKQLQLVEQELATAQTQLAPEHPQIKDLKDRQAALQALLKQNVGRVVGAAVQATPSLKTLQASESQQLLTNKLIETEVERLGLQDQITSIQASQLAYRNRMTIIPRLEQLQAELERQRVVAQANYEGLLKSLQQFSIMENQNVGNVELVEAPSIPTEPVSPILWLNLLFGTVLGLLLGIGTVLLLEALDNSVKTVKEAQDIFDVTVLGTIPVIDAREKVDTRTLERTKPQLPVRDDPRSPISEAYRMLQANLKFLSSDAPPRVMVLTSSVPKEGKSTVTANLALALAELGNRVLVVDADLRRPSQHQIWDLPNSVGLTNILVEPGKWAGVLRSENEQLDVITAGMIPPNPVRLLDSHRMLNLIQEWREAYDFVLIDTPPLAVAADALLTAQMTDGILMVARPGVLNSAAAELAKAALAKAVGDDNNGMRRANLLGLVTNGVVPENEPDSYYYYAAKEYYATDMPDDPVSRNGKASTVLPEDTEIMSDRSTPKP